MTFKKWAWDIFEATGNPEAFLAMKEAEKQEIKNIFGKMEVSNLEVNEINKKQAEKINEQNGKDIK